MTVFYFADTRFPIERANGVQTMATCAALAAHGHDVTLVVRPDTTIPPRDPFAFYGWPPCARLAVRHVPATGGPRVRRARFLIEAGALAARCGGVVYTRDLGLASFLVQLPRSRRPRLVYEAHGIAAVVAAEMPRLLGKPEVAASASKLARLDRRDRRVWRRAAAYVTITQALYDDLTTRYGARERAFVVPDGARLVTLSADPAPAAATPVAAYAGHLYPWKGVDVFVRAIARTTGIRGLVIGGHPAEPDLARVRALAESIGVADRIEFTGLVPPGEVASRLRQASILVLPNTASAISERYTSPLKLFEYLAAARPIVASDLPAFREVLTDHHTAWLVPPGDPDALAAALDGLTADRDLAERLARQAGELAARYTWDARADRLQSVLEAARA